MYEAARNLRTAERFLLAPPLAGMFGAASVAVCDLSERGARFRHDTPIETGTKSALEVSLDGRSAPVELESVVVWSHSEGGSGGRFVSGVRTYAPADLMQSVLTRLRASNRTHRIEELRSTDRFYVTPSLAGEYAGVAVQIEDLSARGARIATDVVPASGTSALLRFLVPESQIEVSAAGEVRWTALKSIDGGAIRRFRAGLFVTEKAELMRLAIGRLCELNRASLDTESLRLKLKILRARARQMAPSFREIEASGIPAEQYLLIQGVREELRLNPEEAIHWYRRARLIINDPSMRAAAPPIADHPDALAVWEYLDRSVDPTIVGRAFEL